MKLGLNTDSLDFMSFENMRETASFHGYETLEFACGNWSNAPHLNLDNLIDSSIKREKFMNALKRKIFYRSFKLLRKSISS